MAKKKIKNMTRAQHKKTLERAVFLQNAAVRQGRERTLLTNSSSGDVYEQVIKAGMEFLQADHHNIRYERIKSYYSRSDVQSAMYNYAKGRKISVLKNFRPMFSGSTLRKPEDVLPIMMFYSEELPLWPSMHGTVSRYDEDGSPLCDLVVEVDYKKSRVRCFNLTRPLIKLFQNLDLEFRIKYSGNASPHVIIPGEAFPEKWRRGGDCRYLYAKLFDFFVDKIKEPKFIDRSFRNSNHFLRLAYSLNENTGLASVPIEIDEYDRFSWQSAYPESVIVLEDWWNIPEDASERTEQLIEFVLDKKRTFAMPMIENTRIQQELTQCRPDIIGKNTQIGMVNAGEEIIKRFTELSSLINLEDILNELRATITQSDIEQRQTIKTLAQKHGVSKEKLVLLWRWSSNSRALEYYTRKDVQEFIYSYALNRCISLGNSDEYFVIEEPSVIYPLIAYVVSEGMPPVFRCTNAKYDPEDERMIACDVLINITQTDDISALDVPCFALYAGDSSLKIVIPFETLNIEPSPSQLSALRNTLAKYIRSRLKTGRASVYLYESSMPIPYTITGDGERVYLPVSLDDLSTLSPTMTNVSAIGTITDLLIPTGLAQNPGKIISSIIV